MNALALYGRYVATSLRAQAQYPTATLMLTAGHCAATAIEILGVFALFHRFGSVGGWSFGEAAVFYALVNIMFSLADMLSRGFEVFGTDFVRYFARVKQSELQRFDAAEDKHEFQRREYFSRF